ncbi:hypothetical protein E5288_WYG000199 [Bos mutus]|uniref:Uncharacterized protein n=1 Tax=Bos mutus TaxID=72004 RepID=A0A6B0QQM9_9CETA|nr:hypothetical protein [Bos mutus]
MLPGGLLHQLLPLLLWLLWGLLQRPRGLLPPPHLQLQLVWLRRWEGLLPAEMLLSAEVQLPEAMLPLDSQSGFWEGAPGSRVLAEPSIRPPSSPESSLRIPVVVEVVVAVIVAAVVAVAVAAAAATAADATRLAATPAAAPAAAASMWLAALLRMTAGGHIPKNTFKAIYKASDDGHQTVSHMRHEGQTQINTFLLTKKNYSAEASDYLISIFTKIRVKYTFKVINKACHPKRKFSFLSKHKRREDDSTSTMESLVG